MKKEFYFLKEGNNIKPYRLKKKSILALMASDHAEVVEKYAKDNNLFFNKEVDIN